MVVVVVYSVVMLAASGSWLSLVVHRGLLLSDGEQEGFQLVNVS